MRKITNEEFRDRGSIKHNYKYNYSKTDVDDRDEKGMVIITCPIHGDFKQKPNAHLQGNGCKLCANELIGSKLRSNSNDFSNKGNIVHNYKYIYTEVVYGKDNNDEVCIICPIHGRFWQTPHNHLKGYGCQKCKEDKLREIFMFSQEEVISNARKVHGDKYDYSEFIYDGCDTVSIIICKEHGRFKQTPYKHINLGHGCPMCKSSHLETEIRQFLTENKIEFEEQKMFDWLGKLKLDFYIPQYNIAIECQGIQHFYPIEHFGGDKALNENKERDERKHSLCNNNNVNILYYTLTEFDDLLPNKIHFSTKENLLKYFNNQ